MDIIFLLGGLAFFVWLGAWIIGAIHVAKRDDLSGVEKGFWIVVFVMMPLIGLLIYLAVGRAKRESTLRTGRWVR